MITRYNNRMNRIINIAPLKILLLIQTRRYFLMHHSLVYVFIESIFGSIFKSSSCSRMKFQIFKSFRTSVYLKPKKIK